MKVGIVIVSFNAAEAVSIALASVLNACNRVPYELLLVDNASAPSERDAIRLVFEQLAANSESRWTFLPQAHNLGFSGGNNVGIRRLLEQPEITHVCLLNGDVIVSNHWLDRLIEKGADIISAVTNKADGDQCVPVDYELELHESFDRQGCHLSTRASRVVTEFAERRYHQWRDQVVEADVTFFVVLLSRQAIDRIGLLDEHFYPGGYEDNDYCIRARAAGIPIMQARDVFIHHWGSASFGQLAHEYFSSQALDNIRYLQNKHQIEVPPRPEGPLCSYMMDMLTAVDHQGDLIELQRYHRLSVHRLEPLIRLFASEFQGISHAVANSGLAPPEALQHHMESARSHPDLIEEWRRISTDVARLLHDGVREPVRRQRTAAQLRAFIDSVHDVATCNLAMHAFLEQACPAGTQSLAPDQSQLSTPSSPFSKLRWLLSKGARFLWHFRGVVFFGGYPYPERQSDGYFQRIQIIDGLFVDRWRVYVESTELVGRDRWFDRPAERVLVLRILGGTKRRMLVRLLALLAVLRCGRIYFHSVLRMHDNGFGKLLYLPWLRRVTDIHGVVPEEFRLHNDFYSARLYEEQERLAVRRSDLIVVVTEAMHQYLRQKYRDELRAEVTAFPMFPGLATTAPPRPYEDGRPVVIYAGGLHKWQQVPKMIDAIQRTHRQCRHLFYSPEPDAVRAMLPPELIEQVEIGRKTHAELMAIYETCHFGFLLREDVVVNHVACPTKAVEYLGKGIVPIIDCEDIGDFKTMGMRAVALADFVAGKIPVEAERDEMAHDNLAIYNQLQQLRDTGSRAIYSEMTDPRPFPLATRIPTWLAHGLRRAFPVNTGFGRALRRLKQRAIRPAPATLALAAARPTPTTEPIFGDLPTSCDILVQVDNFESGGLENVVLDLNDTLQRAGYTLVLLILGTAGTAAARARENGTAVIQLNKVQDHYEQLLDRLIPRLALSHYSPFGAQSCAQRHIPLVQVIHNMYMWLSDAQRAEMLSSAAHTSTFVAVSEGARHYSAERLGVDADKCVVIPNGINSASAPKASTDEAAQALRSALGINPGDFVFLSVGSINHQKNHIAAVKAFAAAIDAMPNARFFILGPTYEPQLLEEIQDFVRRHHLQQRVIYAGSAPTADDYYALADVFVSAAFFEGGPLTLLEAARANLPVIIPETGFACHFQGLPGFQVIEPALDLIEYRGQLWEMHSPPAFVTRLAAAMRNAYDNPQRPDLSSEFLAALDQRNTYQSYLQLIRRLIEDDTLGAAPAGPLWPTMLPGACR